MTQPIDGLDPRLQKWFEALRPTPLRDPQKAAQGLEAFLQEVRSLGQPVSPGAKRRGPGWKGVVRPLTSRENWSMTAVAVLVLSIVVFLGGGAGLTAYASRGALPGDVLYGVKTSLEDAQLALSPTAAGDFRLHLRFAAARVREITALVAYGRFEDAEAAVEALAYQLEQARAALQVVAEEDPHLAAELASRYENFLMESRQALADLALSAPKGSQGVIRDALIVLGAKAGGVESSRTGAHDLDTGADKALTDEASKGPVDDDGVDADEGDVEEVDDDDADELDDDDDVANQPDDDGDDDSDDSTGGQAPDDDDEDDDEIEDDEEPEDEEEPDDDDEEPDDEEPDDSDD